MKQKKTSLKKKDETEVENEKPEKDEKSDGFMNNEQTEDSLKKDKTEVENEKPEKDEKSDGFMNNEQTEDSPKEDETKVENDEDVEEKDGKKDEDEGSVDEKKDEERENKKVDKGDEVDDSDLFYESGSDYEENLVEKWKHLKEGHKLKRYIFDILNAFIK